MPIDDADGSFEAELRASNPKEAAWPDDLETIIGSPLLGRE